MLTIKTKSLAQKNFGIALSFMCLLLVVGCEISEGRNQMDNTDDARMAAGRGEMTFSEKYNLDIHLPMEESEFLSILRNMNLHYQICGLRNDDIGFPPARHNASIDLSNSQICYEIDGDRDQMKGRAEGWRAFVDQRHRVFYIESAYAYSAP